VSLTSGSRRGCVAAIILATICWSAPAASAAVLNAKQIGTAGSVIGTDGVRFAAWRARNGDYTRVFDASDGHTSVIADPPGCGGPVIGAGALLFTCDVSRPDAAAGSWIVNLETGLGRPAVPEQMLGGDGRAFIAVGRRWLQATVSSYHRQVSVFYDRATGEPYEGPSPFAAHRQPDLDRSALVLTICSPLRASTDGLENSPPEISDGYVPLLFSGGWALDTGPIVRSPSQPNGVVLRRCGSTHRRVICRDVCGTPVFVHGQVVWADGVNLLTYRLSDGRRRTLRPRSGQVSGVWRLGHHALVGVRDAADASPQRPLSVRIVSLMRRHK
jgi:hypothetical protein